MSHYDHRARLACHINSCWGDRLPELAKTGPSRSDAVGDVASYLDSLELLHVTWAPR